jgi:hypothetical protein
MPTFFLTPDLALAPDHTGDIALHRKSEITIGKLSAGRVWKTEWPNPEPFQKIPAAPSLAHR